MRDTWHNGKYKIGECYMVCIVRQAFPKEVVFEFQFADCVFQVKRMVTVFLPRRTRI